jgi:hypothetical protein
MKKNVHLNLVLERGYAFEYKLQQSTKSQTILLLVKISPITYE